MHSSLPVIMGIGLIVNNFPILKIKLKPTALLPLLDYTPETLAMPSMETTGISITLYN
jgi:hypothetical protein